jgi:hypothetical protein
VAAVHDMARPYRPTALPSVAARVLAFVAILVGGVCGGLIGYAFMDLQCGPEHGAKSTSGVVREDDGGCDTWSGVGGVVGAVVGAGGTGVVAVLVLRAMSEWRRDLDIDDPPDVD